MTTCHGDCCKDVGSKDVRSKGRSLAPLGRRRLLVGIAATGLSLALSGRAAPARAEVVEGAVRPEDESFMRLALEEAAKADFPFGAVIVRDGRLLARGGNLGRTTNDPTAHGEMVAIRRFLAVYPAGQLEGTTLYSTGEPCSMCMSAILWCRISRLVFAASVAQLSSKINQIQLSSEAVAEATPFRTVEITGGVLADEAMALFR